MDTHTSQSQSKTPRRVGRIVAVVVLVPLFLIVLFLRWVSPDVLIGARITDKWCDNKSGYCIEHLERGDWGVLSSIDDLHVTHGSRPTFYSARNPFSDDAELTVQFGADGVGLTDGSAVISWSAATLAQLDG